MVEQLQVSCENWVDRLLSVQSVELTSDDATHSGLFKEDYGFLNLQVF